MNPMLRSTFTRRLVIVEDEGVLALDLSRYLTGAGFDVRGVAADAESALALVEQERPDLVLMDITIQGPVDGVQAATQLRERFDVPVVYLTAHGDPKTIERAQSTAPLGYLLKPFKKPDLGNMVSIALSRVHAERDLRRREGLLQTTLSCLDEAVVTTDAAGKVTWLNQAAEALTGRSAAQLLQQPLPQVVRLTTDAGQASEVVERARAEGRVRLQGTLWLEDEAREVMGTAAALREGDDDFGVVVALRDLTELLLARRQLEFSERLSALGTLVAGVAHEVNNPLSVVISNLDYALLAPGQSEGREVLTEALEAARRVARIVSDLQVFSRPQSEPLQPMDPRSALGAALHFTRTHWQRVAAVVLDLQAMPAVLAAPTRLSQVFVNLLINAVHALEGRPGPHVLTLSARTDASGRAVVRVSDDGPGIAPALRERIFAPFFTTKPGGKGTGLGLAVSRTIVESLGGQLTLDEQGPGATFVITLPPTPLQLLRPLPSVAWVGAHTPEYEALCQAGVCTTLEDHQRLQPGQADLLLLAVPEAEARAAVARHAELEHHALRVGQPDELRAGCVWLRRPFDLGALAAFARRRG